MFIALVFLLVCLVNSIIALRSSVPASMWSHNRKCTMRIMRPRFKYGVDSTLHQALGDHTSDVNTSRSPQMVSGEVILFHFIDLFFIVSTIVVPCRLKCR